MDKYGEEEKMTDEWFYGKEAQELKGYIDALRGILEYKEKKE